MQVVTCAVDGLKHRYEVFIPTEEIAEKVHQRLVHMTSTARVHGFRRGKVPLPVVKRLYETSVRSEEREKLVSDSVRSLIKERNLRLSKDPQVTGLEANDEGMRFSVELSALPVFEVLENYENFSFTRLRPEIAPSEIDERIGTILSAHTGWDDAPAEHRAQNGDRLTVDLLARSAKKSTPDEKSEDVVFILGSQKNLPECERALAGAATGEHLSFIVEFPKSFPDKSLAQTKISYEVQVKKLQVPVKRDTAEALARDLGFEDLQKFQDSIKASLENDFNETAYLYLKRQVLDALAERYNFPVPEEMENEEYARIWKQLETEKGGDLDKLSAEQREVVEKDYRFIADRRVRLGLAIAGIGQKANIQVTKQDLEVAVRRMAMRDPLRARMIFEYYAKNPRALESVRATIFEDKVVAYIVEKSQMANVSLSRSELAERLDKEEGLPSEKIFNGLLDSEGG